jgi:hypothetical protein
LHEQYHKEVKESWPKIGTFAFVFQLMPQAT